MMKRFKVRRFWALLLPFVFLLALASGCTSAKRSAEIGSKASQPPVEVNVWAASSLKDALTKLAPAFEKANHAKLVFNFASSGDLETQIEQGARADVFLSAGKKQMDALAQKHLIDPASRVDFLGNSLVVAAPSTSKVKITRVEYIAGLQGIRHIAIGNPDAVPAGKYAQQSLEMADVFEAVKPKLVFAKDVRQVLAYIESGNADLGFVYASDLKVAKNVRNVLTVPDRYHDTIVYPLAVVRAGKQPKLAAKFTEYLNGETAQKVFMDSGFEPYPSGVGPNF